MRARKNRNKKMKTNLKNAAADADTYDATEIESMGTQLSQLYQNTNIVSPAENKTAKQFKEKVQDPIKLLENENIFSENELAEPSDDFSNLSLTRGFIDKTQTQEYIEIDQKFVQSLTDMEDRNRQITQLSGDIEQLYDIMTDLDTIVKEQGETLNLVENNTEIAYAKMEQAHAELIVADADQSSSSKLKYTLIGIPAIIIATMVAIIKS